jgi:CRISPR-associated protein Cas2
MEKKNTNRTGLNGNYNTGEQAIFVLYDVESDKIRRKIFIACEDYGLKSIQFSTFFGSLSINKCEELYLRLKKVAGEKDNHIIIIPVCRADYRKIMVNGKNISLYQTNFLEII